MTICMPHRRFPCGECPVVKDNDDNPRSKFPAERWEMLRATVEDRPGDHALLGAPLFGCHEGAPGTGADMLCAGWAAAFGRDSVELRVAIATGRLPADVLDRGAQWPELYETWDDMVAGQTLQPGEPDDHLPPELRRHATRRGQHR
jgi:hypothetical protein